MRKLLWLAFPFALACGTADDSPMTPELPQMDGGGGSADTGGGGAAGSSGSGASGGSAGNGGSGGNGGGLSEAGDAPAGAPGDSGDARAAEDGAARDAKPIADAQDATDSRMTSEAGQDGGSFACGTQTCAADEWCEYPCCGTLPACMPAVGDAGQCATGFAACRLGDGATGCQYTCTVPSCTKSPPRVGCIEMGRTVRCTCA